MGQLNLSDINFPIYAITNNYKRIYEDLNVLFIETPTGRYVLDNKNMLGKTIGERRLKITNSKLYIPRKIFYTLAQMLNSKYSTFIDNYGKVFNYKKSKFVPLVYYKVEDITRAKDGECILEIPEINYSYKTTCKNAYGILYLGLLCTDFGYIPYEFSEIYKKPSRRKI